MFEAVELGLKVSKEEYDKKVPDLRIKLLQAQEQLKDRKFPVLILIHGAEGAGKGEVLNTLHEWMDPRFLQTTAFGPLTEEELARPEAWRFWQAMPPKGRTGIFFGSWYTRPILQRAAGESKAAELERAIEHIRLFEKALTDDGLLLLKFWFHLSKKDQKKRLETLEEDPRTAWRVSKLDWKMFKMYDRFRGICEKVLQGTHTAEAPWTIVEAKDRRHQCLVTGTTILEALTARLAQAPPPKLPAASAAGTPPKEAKKGAPGAKTHSVLDRLDLTLKLDDQEYKERLEEAQGRVNRLWRKAWAKGRSAVLVFEGWDAGGKGGAIRRLTGALDARSYRVIPIAAPTEEERAQHYLWRFWRHLPGRGRVVVFDRSWYGRVMVERVEGFAREDEWKRAYLEINEFEGAMARHGYILLKFFLHISPEEQLRRFKERQKIAWKQFKITDEDWRNREKWDAYETAVSEMVERTSTPHAPWTLVEAVDKNYARIKVLETFADAVKKAL
jgi:polyphosphate:AMP phosphotransferase